MKLKSFGCSFTFGTDLPDDRHNDSRGRPSNLTWAALVAQRQNWEYCCYARPGSGNLQILESVLSQAASNEQDFYVINWTWIDRFDYTTISDQWKTIMPVDTDSTAKVYYRDLHSQYRDKFTTLVAMRTAVDTLTKKGIPFVMTAIDDLVWETQWHTTPAIIDCQQHIRKSVKDFQGKTFLEWSRQKGYAISDSWHPLEEAHRAAAEIMWPTIDATLRKV